MPGMVPSLEGGASFLGLKFAGYVAIAHVLHHKYGVANERHSPFTIGFTKTTIGVVVGVAYWFAVFAMAPDESTIKWVYGFYGLLLPVRLLEWILILWWFFDRKLERAPTVKNAFLAAIATYGLDAIGAFLISVIPGGMTPFC